MTIYVDDLRTYKNRRFYGAKKIRWCHMMTDSDISELHEMAQKIGLQLSWFQDHPLHPHYDLVGSKRQKALEAGAIAVSTTELIKRCSKYDS